MNGKLRTIRLLACFACSILFFNQALAQTISVKSPDGKNEIKIFTEPTLSYSVLRSGIERVGITPIAIEIEGKKSLGGAGLKISSIDTSSPSEKIPSPLYKKAFVDTTANAMTITFEDGWKIALVARNDGVAYRFETDFPGKVRVINENAGIGFPATSKNVYAAYCNSNSDPLQCSWEAIYTTTTANAVAKGGETVYLPLVVKYADGQVLCVSESDLLDYPGWNLKRAKGDLPALEAKMARYPKKTLHKTWGREGGDKPLRYMRVVERENYLAETSGKRTYPWRVFMLAQDESKLCEADIVYALASPSKIGKADWVKPGKVAWEWWNSWNISKVPFRAGINTATYEYYIDFAAEFGIEYVIMDEGWSKHLQIMEINSQIDLPHLVKYANARKVGIILWCAWPQLIGRQDEVFSKYAKMGVKGFKIDFMDRDDQVLEQYLEDTARIAAKYKLIIDYHGMHKPTGFSRTYPNVLNYEGVHGLEQVKWENNSDFMRNDLLVYFCRMTAGAMDYTPGAMNNMTKSQFRANSYKPGSQGTRVHQMALMSLYEAPLQMLCDSPTQYLSNRECFEFMAKVPVVWDETIGLAGSMEDYAVAARKKDDVWYLSAISSWKSRTIEVDTSFLGEGKWRAEIFADGINADRDATDYVRSVETIKAGEKIRMKLAPGGGWTARFVRKGMFW